MPPTRGAAALVVALAGAGLLVGLLGFSSTLNPLDALLGRGAIVVVPDLTGRPQPGAEAELRSAGLDPQVRSSYSLTGRRGSVIGQKPAAGSRVREGSDVVVVVSRGVNRVAMPDAVGKSFKTERRGLDEAGVHLKVRHRTDEEVPKGMVISQDPGPGVLVTGDDSVSFEVSDGPAKRPVPNVTGLDLEGAAFLLGKAGLDVGEVTPTDDAGAPVGSVLRTEPAVGTVVERGTVVNVAEAAGPPAVALPDLVGQGVDAASGQLTRLGFVPNVIRQRSGNQVTTQDPPATTPLRPGAIVTLSVGSGG